MVMENLNQGKILKANVRLSEVADELSAQVHRPISMFL